VDAVNDALAWERAATAVEDHFQRPLPENHARHRSASDAGYNKHRAAAMRKLPPP